MDNPREGQTIYRVFWREGIPYVRSGKVIVTGKKSKRLWALIEGEKIQVQSVQESIQEAVKESIVRCTAHHVHNPNFRQNEPPRPFKLACLLSRLLRLSYKLQKLNLMRVPEE